MPTRSQQYEPPMLGTSEARRALPRLVEEAIAREQAAPNPGANAVRIQPRGEQRSASLVPTIDLEAADARIEELEEALENAGIALFLHDRLGSATDDRLSTEQFLERIGMEQFIEQLPGRS